MAEAARATRFRRWEVGPEAGVSVMGFPVPWARAARLGLLGASDVLALLLAGTFAFLLWADAVRGQSAAIYLPLAPLTLLVVLGYAQAGLYPGFGLGPVETIRRYWLVTATAFVLMAALIFGLKVQNVYSRVTLALAFVLSLACVTAFRWVTIRLLRRQAWWPEPVLLVGGGDRVDRTRELLEGSVGREFRPVAYVQVDAAGSDGDPSLGDVIDDARTVAEAGIRVAFVDIAGPGAEMVLDRLRLIFPRVIILREFEELPVEGVQVRNLGGVLGLEYGNNLLRRQSRWVKRTLDVVVGAIALLLTLPLTLAALALVRVLSPGPALFWHSREGRRGRTIRVPKVRTMVLDAEQQMEDLLRSDPGVRDAWEAAFKLQDDPRVIPRIGRLFRRFSVDELPQLWSVLRGDMSLVGPRPFPTYHLNALSSQARHLRAEVRPGITGLWQVTARGEADLEAQQAYDIYYIRNWSIWLDIHILARTASAVISGKGAH